MIFWFLVVSLLWADSKTLMAAKTQEEFIKVEQQWTQEQYTKERCREERERALFPEHCFYWLEKPILSPRYFREGQKLYWELTQVCQIRGEEPSPLEEDALNQLMATPFLPTKCIKLIERWREDEVYRTGISVGPKIEQ